MDFYRLAVEFADFRLAELVATLKMVCDLAFVLSSF